MSGGQHPIAFVDRLVQHPLDIALMIVVKPGKTDCYAVFTFTDHLYPLAAQFLRIIHNAVKKQFQHSAILDIAVLQLQKHAGEAQTGDVALLGVVMFPAHGRLDGGWLSLV